MYETWNNLSGRDRARAHEISLTLRKKIKLVLGGYSNTNQVRSSAFPREQSLNKLEKHSHNVSSVPRHRLITRIDTFEYEFSSTPFFTSYSYNFFLLLTIFIPYSSRIIISKNNQVPLNKYTRYMNLFNLLGS